jgi:hypothetical protein
MLEKKAPGSVWNVAFVAVAMFIAAMAISGILLPAEVGAVAASL